MCGWGSVIFGTSIEKCRKNAHMGWLSPDVATETCQLNELTDDDGNPLVDKIGCMTVLMHHRETRVTH